MTDMLAAYGYSAGCAGCRHKRSGFTGARDQTDACRRRIAEAIRADNSERASRFQVSVSRAQVRLGLSKESHDAVVLADEPGRVEEDGRSTPVLSERAPEEEEEAVLDALEDNPEAGSVVDVVEMYSPPRTTPVARRMGLVEGHALNWIYARVGISGCHAIRKQLCGMFERCGRSWSLAAQGAPCSASCKTFVARIGTEIGETDWRRRRITCGSLWRCTGNKSITDVGFRMNTPWGRPLGSWKRSRRCR